MVITNLDNQYKKKLSRVLGWRWNLTGRLAKKTWQNIGHEKGDQRIGGLIRGLSLNASAEDLSALLFDYRFERYGLRFIPYLLGLR